MKNESKDSLVVFGSKLISAAKFFCIACFDSICYLLFTYVFMKFFMSTRSSHNFNHEFKKLLYM